MAAQALELLKRVTYHNCEWSNERGNIRRTAGILELDALSTINAQFDQLIKRLDRIRLSQMPSYAKFFKEILSKKRKQKDYETVALTNECSAILQNKLPPKLKDPGSFSISFLIGNMNIDKALCDLGASVSLMSLSVCQKLEVGELKPTTISLQLVDRSVKYPVRIIENTPIKVGKFFIPVDFVVLEMEENVQIPIILGRPFLAIAGAIIDVKNERLTLKVGDEEVEFNLFNTMKHKLKPDECFKVDIVDKQVEEEFQKVHPEDPLKACIVQSHTVDNENIEITACEQSLATNPPTPLAQAFKVEELKEEQPKSKSEDNTKQVELKFLPSSLRYAFLDSNSKYPIIINASLSEIEEEKLLKMGI
ncbi:uncharacterized protein LOC131173001 [Hevea brasiliensis]|uniref:uncharacterized protein LOC131173001 n=1 Tax=Hevea brasiliensis TaxID=3981 RepID=UPI0025F3B044|nr:uncharacterized protein LOC131173001 [Hevea brasiliensis]